jgi:hypothetical protein
LLILLGIKKIPDDSKEPVFKKGFGDSWDSLLIVLKKHYFVCQISKLDSSAKRNKVLIISGASLIPALSSAVLEEFRNEFSEVDSLVYGILGIWLVSWITRWGVRMEPENYAKQLLKFSIYSTYSVQKPEPCIS